MLMYGVDRNAQRMVSEIHRQFREIKGLKEGNTIKKRCQETNPGTVF